MKNKLLLFLAALAGAAHAEKLPGGQFIEVFAGAKMGGTAYHQALHDELVSDPRLKGLRISCVIGSDRSALSQTSAAEIDRQSKSRPSEAKHCKGSGSLLIGPAQAATLPSLKAHIENNYMHVYLSTRSFR